MTWSVLADDVECIGGRWISWTMETSTAKPNSFCCMKKRARRRVRRVPPLHSGGEASPIGR
ncbi:unnamed protein product [Ranitomeya imitator]|uniref:Uncharacterized protein n=1 Tax=Ranitomeya imitator TaxID=111125 RepID=A0ABN9LQE1_9NEOB|nr:unnamed protein product [Ranitomeya imitator]